MNLREMVADLYTATGELPDLEYRDIAGAIDIGSRGWQTLVRYLNEAQDAIASWTHSDGRRLRLRLSEEVARAQCSSETREVASFDGQMMTLTGPSHSHDFYRGFMIEGPQGSALVFASYGPTTELLILSDVTGTFVVGQTVTLVSREISFLNIDELPGPYPAGSIWYSRAQGRPIEITEITGTDGATLALVSSQQHLDIATLSRGRPTSYIKFAHGLRFDVYPDDAYMYIVRYMRLPRELRVADPTDEGELPAQFHRALVLYSLWFIHLREHETDKAYSVRRTLEDMLKRTQTEFDFQDRVQQGQIFLAGER